jgi:hypothetical protein
MEVLFLKKTDAFYDNAGEIELFKGFLFVVCSHKDS